MNEIEDEIRSLFSLMTEREMHKLFRRYKLDDHEDPALPIIFKVHNVRFLGYEGYNSYFLKFNRKKEQVLELLTKYMKLRNFD